MQKTFDVEHPGSHEPTSEQVTAALRDALKADGLKMPTTYEVRMPVNVSGGPSKMLAIFDEAAPRAQGKPRASRAKTPPAEPVAETPAAPAGDVTSPVDNAAGVGE